MKKIIVGLLMVVFGSAGIAFGQLSDVGFITADGTELPEGCGGYILQTNGDPTTDYLIDFNATESNTPLVAVELFLVDIKAQDPVSLANYYANRGVPEPYLSYLINAADVGADAQTPFAYIDTPDTTGDGPYLVSLYDGAHFSLSGGLSAVPMIIPGDYPCGTYTVATDDGEIFFTLTILGDHCGDLDGDCYPDDQDLCLETGGDVPDVRLGVNRWIYNEAGVWESFQKGKGKGPEFEPDIWYTYGCSCEQVLDAMSEATGGAFKGHYKFGCSKSILEDWNSGVYILDDGTEIELW